MKPGDLVTVLPAGDSAYLVIDFIRGANILEVQEGLGSLWALYSEEIGVSKMHEKWMEMISESR